MAQSINIHNLPVEVMIKILRGCLPVQTERERHSADFDYNTRESRSSPERWAPVPFTAVCHHWRSVVLSHSSLWSILYLTVYYETYEVDLDYARSALQFWLRHSKEPDLSLCMDFYNVHGTMLSEDWHLLSPFMDDVMMRCRQVEIRLRGLKTDIPEPLFQQIEHTAGNLEHLILLNSGGYEIDEITQAQRQAVLRIITNGRLRSFQGSNFIDLSFTDLAKAFNGIGMARASPCITLRHLELPYMMRGSTLHFLLNHLPCLEEASLAICEDRESGGLEINEIGSMEVICLPRLYKLSVSLWATKDYRESQNQARKLRLSHLEQYEPFHRILLPALQNLQIRVPDGSGQSDIVDINLRGIAASLRSSGSKLDILSVYTRCYCTGMKDIFEAAMVIRKFSIMTCTFDRASDVFDMLSGLGPDGTDGMLLPELEELDYSVWDMSREHTKIRRVVAASLVKLIRSRWDGTKTNIVDNRTSPADLDNAGTSGEPDRRSKQRRRGATPFRRLEIIELANGPVGKMKKKAISDALKEEFVEESDTPIGMMQEKMIRDFMMEESDCERIVNEGFILVQNY